MRKCLLLMLVLLWSSLQGEVAPLWKEFRDGMNNGKSVSTNSLVPNRNADANLSSLMSAPSVDTLASFPNPAGRGKGTLYVNVNNKSNIQDGKSWETAYNDLQDALTDAETNLKISKIKIACGVYKPSKTYTPLDQYGNPIIAGTFSLPQYNPGIDNDGNLLNYADNPSFYNQKLKTFQLINGVDLIGGYKVNGNKAKRTKAKCCATILDGNLGTDVNPDYVWHVLMAGNDLTHHGISCNLINLTIQNANASQAPYFPINYFLNPGQIPIYYHDDGAGLYVVCRSQINICHVTMQHLNAIAGGALYADDGSIINIIKSKFIQNIGIDGGAIQIRSGGQNDLTDFAKRTTACFIDRCKFCDNQGVQGSVGGYDNYGIDINTGGPNLKIVDSEFYDRTPFGTIASITTQLELINCLFDHQGREGIGVWIFFVTNNRFKGCTFKNFYNSLDFPGAAISVTAPLMNYNYLEISNCSFENNITIDQLGGAISLRAIFPGLPIYARIENNEFIHNKSTIAGGAIYLDQGAIILNNNWPANRFKGNDAPIEKNIFAEQGVYLPPPFCCKDP